MSQSLQRIAITGANGFVGRALCGAALARGLQVTALTRSPFPMAFGGQNIVIGDIDVKTRWIDALDGCDVVVHLAAHQPNVNTAAAMDACRRINVRGTENLANQAAAAGVRRLVFMSSIKVNGEISEDAKPFTEACMPAPVDAYGISKWEAEQCLAAVAAHTPMEVVVVRSPLVYGPGVRGNFRSLVRLATMGAPLPLKNIHNKRSLVSQRNLIDFLMVCCVHPEAAQETFLVSDAEDVSIPDLLARIGAAAGISMRLFSIPVAVLKVIAMAAGRGDWFTKLSGNLQADISKARTLLGWCPPQNLDEGLRQLMGRSSK